MLDGTLHSDPAVRLPTRLRHLDLQLTAEVHSGDTARILHDLLRRTGRDDLTALRTGARSDVDDVIGGTHGILIMFDDDHGIPEVTKVLQRRNQTIVIPLMQADTRLIEDIGDPDETGADLCREADTLRLTTGKGTGGPAQGQVIETDIQHELNAAPDLLHDLIRDLMLHRRQPDLFDPVIEVLDGELRRLVDIEISDRYGETRGLQTCAMAECTWGDPHVLLIVRTHTLGEALTVTAVYIGQQALEGHLMHISLSKLGRIADRHLLALRAVQDDRADLRRVVLKWRVEAEMIGLTECHQHRMREAALILRVHPARNGDRSFVQTQALVRNHQRQIKLHLIADTAALRAGTEGVVKGEAARLDLVDGNAAVRAGETRREVHRLTADHVDGHLTAGQAHDLFDRLGETRLDALADHETIDHDLDGMADVLIEADVLRKLIHVSVHTYTHIAGAAGRVEHLLMHALLAADNRCQQLNPAALRHQKQLIHDLIHRLALDLASALRTVRRADACVQKTHIIINLRDGTDRRTRIPVRRLLIDRNRRAETLDEVHRRLLHLAQKLTRIG